MISDAYLLFWTVHVGPNATCSGKLYVFIIDTLRDYRKIAGRCCLMVQIYCSSLFDKLWWVFWFVHHYVNIRTNFFVIGRCLPISVTNRLLKVQEVSKVGLTISVENLVRLTNDARRKRYFKRSKRWWIVCDRMSRLLGLHGCSLFRWNFHAPRKLLIYRTTLNRHSVELQ